MFLAGLSIILEKSYIVIKTLNPNLTDVPLKFGCFIHEPSIIKLIAYMKEPSGFKSSFEGLLTPFQYMKETSDIEIYHFLMVAPLVFWITFPMKTTQTVTIFEITKNFIPQILG